MHAIDLASFEDRPRSPRRSRTVRKPVTRAAPRRRAARSRPDAGQALLRFWNEHAVKSGLMVFYAWFAAANWQPLRQVVAETARYWIG